MRIMTLIECAAKTTHEMKIKLRTQYMYYAIEARNAVAQSRLARLDRWARPSMSSEDEEITKPPERRAPSGRASKGNRMSKLLAEEAVDEDAADKDFYQQGFWADEEADDDFAGDADDEDGADSFDSDFGESTESEDDEDEDEADKKVKQAPAKKSSAYKDPKKKAGGAGASGAGQSGASKSNASLKKRPRPEGDIVVEARSRGSLRGTTQASSAEAEENRKKLEAAAAARRERLDAMGAKRGVELRRLTQAEILAEAAQTEIINRASLERMLRQEEDKRRVLVRERNADGPRIKFHSKRKGDVVSNTLTFTDMPVPSTIDDIAPPYPATQRCAVTQAPAKYLDPVTNQPYATLEAFKILRGRTGRRQHSFSGVGKEVAPSVASADD
jgi:vacuolar protein sorting-associated protein 72